MNKEKIERALTEIDDKYLEEAANYKAGNMADGTLILFRKRGRKSTVAAAAMLAALLAMGGVTTYAVTKRLRDVQTNEKYVYVLNAPTFGEELEDEESNSGTSLTTYQAKGDETTLWLTKQVDRHYYGGSMTKTYTYTYASYEDAAKHLETDTWFASLPGEYAKNVESVVYDNEGFDLKSIYVYMTYGNGEYDFSQVYLDANLADEFGFGDYFAQIDEEFDYTNGNGVSFHLVSGERPVYADLESGETVVEEMEAVTTCIISYDKYYGSIDFKDLSKKEIQKILDCFR